MLKYDKFINESFLPKDKQDFVDKVNKLEKNILSSVKNIIMQEEGISEKNFTYINAMNVSFDKFIPSLRNDREFHTDIQSFENKRSTFAAEFIYDKYFKEKFKISQ